MTEETMPTRESTVSLREITEETVEEIINLSKTLSEAQRKMVADNAKSIAQAHFSKHAWFRAIYAGETPVGFIMLYDNPDEPEYFLWRFMVAGPHQGKGYGRKAIDLLLDYVRTRPGAKELLTSCVEGEASPEGFYRRLGFERNGQMYGDEVGLRLEL
jgi:diamine N-acetyltransferase